MPAASSIKVDTFLARFGRAMQKRRLDAFLSVRQAAERLEIQPSALQEIEAGARDLKITTAIRIAKRLGLSIDELARLS